MSALEGIDAGTAATREVIHTDTQKFLLGQSFTLSAAQVAGGGFQLGEIFLKSANSKNFTNFVGNFEITVYQGEGAGATLLDTYSFDMASFTDGDTNTIYDVHTGDWVRFTLDGGGANLTTEGVYSFLMFWDQSSGANSLNKWAFYRSPNPGDVYAGGVQYENTAFVVTDWPATAWTGTTAANAGVRDLGFYVGEALVGNQPPVANPQSLSIFGVETAITLTGSDLDGDALTFITQDSPTNGTLGGSAPDLTYTPDDSGFNGVDGFTFVVTDGTATSTPATVSLALFDLDTPTVEDVGTATPSAGAIASHLAPVTEGNREVRWDSATVHSLGGQSFKAVADGTAKSITLKVRSTETFANWTSDSFQIQVFDGVGAASTSLGFYKYDATALGSWNNHWVKFSLGSGIPMTNGVTYSFLIVCGAEDSDHRINFGRDGNSAEYSDGNEMRGGNAYDVENFATDPWDVAAPIGQTVNTAQTGDMLFSIDGDIGPPISPLEQWIIDYALTGSATNLMADLPDDDGVINLLEYALGGNPNDDDAAAILPTYEVNGDWLYYIYNRQNPADPALSYAVLSSTDLVTIPITNATEEVGASAAENGFESVTNRISTASEDAQFMDLKVQFTD